MKKEIGYLILAASLITVPMGITGCAVTQGRESAKSDAKDKEITARITTALYGDKAVKGTQVQVNSLEGVVQLSGFVNTQEEKDRAGQIASSTPGVVRVYNNLLLPTGSSTGHRPADSDQPANGNTPVMPLPSP